MGIKLRTKHARLSMAAAICMVLSVIGVVSLNTVPRVLADTSGPWTYTVSGGEATITAYDFNTGGATPVIPSSLGGSPVVTLGDGVFSDMSITAVTLPNSLKTIGNSTFSTTSLTSVAFPNSLETIGYSAFADTPLTSIIIPDSVTSILSGAFAGSSASTIVVGTPGFSGTPHLSISPGAFADALVPVEVTIYNNLATITTGSLPTDTITSLTIGTADFTGTPSVVIPSNLLSGAPNLISATFGKNVLSIGGYSFIGSSLANLTLSEGLASIGDSAFANTHITSMSFPSTLTSIGNYTFQYSSLADVDIPGTVLTVGNGAFESTPLTSLTMHEGTTTIGDRAFYGTHITEFTLPMSATNLGGYIFTDSLLERLTIGSTNFSGTPTFVVPSYTFVYMGSIQSVTFGKNVKSIDENAFAYGNDTLRSITLPSTIESIGDYAFNQTGLTELTIPASLTHIGAGAFMGTNITTLYIPSTVTSIGSGAFTDLEQLTSLTIGEADFSGTPTLALQDSFMAGAGQLTSVSIGKNVVSIGSSAFASTPKLSSLTIPATVASMGWEVFINSGITSVTVLGNPTIEDTTFKGAGLDTTTMPSDLQWGGPTYSYRQGHAQLLQIYAVDPAFAATLAKSKLYTDKMYGNIYSSSDSGDTWGVLTTPVTSGWFSVTGSSDAQKLISRVRVDEDNPGTTYGSDDGGATWTARSTYASNVFFSDIASNNSGTRLVGVKFTSSNSTQGNVFISTDGGVNWIPGTTPNTSQFTAVASSGDGTKLVAIANRSSNGTSANVYTSTDSGATWMGQTTPNSRYWKEVASSDDGTYLAAVTDGGYIYTSSNSGTSWTARALSRPWREVAVSSTGQYMVAIAGNYNIYTSSDYGVNWTERTNSGARGWTSVSMSANGQYIIASNSNNGYDTENGHLYYSSDYGATWSEKQIGGVTHNWDSVFMSDDGTKIFAVNAQSNPSKTEELFATSGYIVNPASVNAAFVKSTGDALAAPLHYTARIAGTNGAADIYRTDYALQDALDLSNPNQPVLDLDPYFFNGSDAFAVEPPAINGYVTPDAFTYTFATSGANQHDFRYYTTAELEQPSQGGSNGQSGGGTKQSSNAPRTVATVAGPTDDISASTGGDETAPDADVPDSVADNDNDKGDASDTTAKNESAGSIVWVAVGGGVLFAVIVGMLLVRHRRHTTL